MDFTILKDAGVTQNEFAELVGASRGSVNNWLRGRNHPRALYEKEVRRVLTLVTVAHRMNLLPGELPVDYKGNLHARRDYIRDSLRSAANYIRKKKAEQRDHSRGGE